jgi:hypothetical protein
MRPPSRFQILAREFCDNFEKGARYLTWRGTARSPSLLGEFLLLNIFLELKKRLGERAVRELFAEFAPKKPHAAAAIRQKMLLFKYFSNGKPPKRTFAREMAKQNADALKNGKPEFLWGSGATDTDTMLGYLKDALKARGAAVERRYTERRKGG